MRNNKFLSLLLKGMGMGAANVIPGVSGGTIALITGIFEPLINSIKSFNGTAVKLLLKGKFKEFSEHINLGFLIPVLGGIAVSIISIAKLFEFLFLYYPIYIWSFFFGLILASVYFVGRTVEKWKLATILSFLVGATIATSFSFLNPATENGNIFYLLICGVVAACSMILPGLSGSFVLILMGNYQLVMIEAVSNLNLGILIPVVIGAGFGLLAFSYILSWVFKKYKDITIALLTGFIFGSISLLWPWKNSYNAMGELISTNRNGAFTELLSNPDLKIKVYNYDQIFPGQFGMNEVIAIGLMIVGVISIYALERTALKKD